MEAKKKKKQVEFTYKKGKSMDILVEFLIGYLQSVPYSTSVCFALYKIQGTKQLNTSSKHLKQRFMLKRLYRQ